MFILVGNDKLCIWTKWFSGAGEKKRWNRIIFLNFSLCVRQTTTFHASYTNKKVLKDRCLILKITLTFFCIRDEKINETLLSFNSVSVSCINGLQLWVKWRNIHFFRSPKIHNLYNISWRHWSLSKSYPRSLRYLI